MMQISTPNAAYKIGSLVRKGYVEKIQSTTDRREYHLRPTQKYIDYYNISYSYLSTVVRRVRQRFPEEDVDKLEQMLTIISDELMPELDHAGKKVLIVHQQVIANAIRQEIRTRSDEQNTEVTVASWFMMKSELSEEGDLSLKEEMDYCKLVQNGNYDIVFADENMRGLVPGFKGTFVNIRHFAVSGKLQES